VTKTIEDTIPSYFKSINQISREKLGNLIKEDFPELSEGTITVLPIYTEKSRNNQ
jgi:hypothetical protein